MATASISGTVIFSGALYRGNGDVIAWCRKVTLRFEGHAKRVIITHGRVRTGELLRGIEAETRRVGPHQVQGVIGSRAGHSLFVLKGTGPWIHPKVAPRLFLNPGWTPSHGQWAGKFYSERMKSLVAGQEAFDFMGRAWSATARQHPSIRGAALPF